MDSKRWEKLEALVEQALNLPDEERSRFLSKACGTDTEQRLEIESLLSYSDKAFLFTKNFPENFILPAYFQLEAQQERVKISEQTSLINKVIGHYHIIRKIGSGGMGVVYKARDLRLGRFVAVKLLPPNLTSNPRAKQRFISEAKAVSALDHPNICTLYEISETDADRLFMVMAWYKGHTLKTWIKKGALHARQVLHYARQIADGLASAHKAGFTHRDVKPANIMITDDEVVKILDFGIAKKLQNDQPRENTAIGSLPYMSPEQVRGEEVDHRSDIWALGVVLYEMLTGKRPFDGETDAAVLHAILHNEPTPARDVQKEAPAALEEIVNKCLAKDPDLRYQHIDEVLVDLKRADREAASVKARKFSMLVIPILLVLAMAALFLRSETVPVSDIQRSIAVLPFENLSPDPDDTYFADGVHEDIIIQLSQIGDLRPIARSSVLRYNAEGRNLQQIAEELNVFSVLEGNVRRSENEIQVSVQLVDPYSLETLWANSYQRNQLTGLFDIQRSIAVEIAAALHANLTPHENTRLSERPTEVAEAYEFYLRAREYFSRTEYLEEDYRRAENLLYRAIELDSEFVNAYALLSRVYSKRRGLVGSNISHQTTEDSRRNAYMALQLNSESAEAHLAVGYHYYFVEWNFDNALKHYQIALQMQPNNAEIMSAIAFAKRRVGKFEESLEHLKSSISLDPLNPDLRFDIAVTYTALGDYESADTEFETALSLSPDFHIAGYYHHFNNIIWKGETETAFTFLRNHEHFKHEHPSFYLMLQFMIRDFEGIIKTVSEVPEQVHRIYLHMYPTSYFLGLAYDYLGEPEKGKLYYEIALSNMNDLPPFWHDDPGYHMALGRLYAVMGMEEEAIAEIERVNKLLSPRENHVFVREKWYNEYLAFIYAQLEKTDESVELIRRLFKSESGYISVPRLKTDPVWDPIRGTQEFQELIEEFL